LLSATLWWVLEFFERLSSPDTSTHSRRSASHVQAPKSCCLPEIFCRHVAHSKRFDEWHSMWKQKQCPHGRHTYRICHEKKIIIWL
jgi:hypothetical protein